MVEGIVSAMVIFLVSQYVNEYILKPDLEFNRTRAKIDNKLKFYGNVVTNPGDLLPKDVLNKCSEELRQLSCELEVGFKELKFISNKIEVEKKVSRAAMNLIFLSNNLYSKGEGLLNAEKMEEIRKCLGLRELKGDIYL